MSESIAIGTHHVTRPPSQWLKRALAVLALCALAALLWWIWSRVPVVAWLERAGPVPFFTLMAILPALGVPITPLFVIAGASFGARLGLAGSLLAIAGNLCLCYVLSRALRPSLASLFRRLGYQLPDLGKSGKGAAGFTAAVKLAPGLPQFAKNYVLGMAGVPFGVYFGLSMLIGGAYAASLVVLGHSLLEHDRERAAIAGAVLVVLVAGVWLWHRRRTRRANRSDPS